MSTASLELERSPATAKKGRKAEGAYFTPEHVARTLVKWVLRSAGDRLLDPSCGDGGFLKLHRHVTGIEQNPSSAAAACLRAPWARVHVDDFFRWAGETTQRFDAIVGNPPFVRYQSFTGTQRERALELCRRHGVEFSGLASSWVPFLIASTTLLESGGRMAFVVPAEIGHAPYAVPLIRFLSRSFERLQLVAIRETLFSELSQDVWLLYAEGFGGDCAAVGLTCWEKFRACESPPASENEISWAEWESWCCRLRPFVLPAGIRQMYRQLAGDRAVFRLGGVARVGIGYVTGANEFFHLRPSQARALGIPREFLLPTVRNGRCLPESAVDAETVAAWEKQDAPCLLLRIGPTEDLPASVKAYLRSAAGDEAKQSFKCRTRTPWYSVPGVLIPDGFLAYMSNGGPALVANEAECACTNSVHAVRVKKSVSVHGLQRMWNHPLTRLSTELEGHPLGGGVLKLEPGEANRVILPKSTLQFSPRDLNLLDEGAQTLRSWRHHV